VEGYLCSLVPRGLVGRGPKARETSAAANGRLRKHKNFKIKVIGTHALRRRDTDGPSALFGPPSFEKSGNPTILGGVLKKKWKKDFDLPRPCRGRGARLVGVSFFGEPPDPEDSES